MQQAELKTYVIYDANTGVFSARCKRNKIKPGDILGYKRPDGYVQFRVNGIRKLAHQWAYLYTYGYIPEELDHINLDKSDNRISNLRPITRSLNMHNTNKPVTNTSGYKGIWLDKRVNKWVAELWLNREKIYIGNYDSPDIAYAAYCNVAKQYLKEYARLA